MAHNPRNDDPYGDQGEALLNWIHSDLSLAFCNVATRLLAETVDDTTPPALSAQGTGNDFIPRGLLDNPNLRPMMVAEYNRGSANLLDEDDRRGFVYDFVNTYPRYADERCPRVV